MHQSPRRATRSPSEQRGEQGQLSHPPCSCCENDLGDRWGGSPWCLRFVLTWEEVMKSLIHTYEAPINDTLKVFIHSLESQKL